LYRGHSYDALRRIAVIACLVLLLPSCRDTTKGEEVHVVSLINLIATPAQYDGRWVSVQGVVEVSSDGEPALFLTVDDAAYGNVPNAICIATDGSPDGRWPVEGGEWVGIRGVFDSSNRCHFGLFAGTIRDIDRFEPLTASSISVGATKRQPPVEGKE
jgi:hypothetical protein